MLPRSAAAGPTDMLPRPISALRASFAALVPASNWATRLRTV